MSSVGQVFGDTTATKFRFKVVGKVGLASYVSLQHEGREWLAQVTELERSGTGGELVADGEIVGAREDGRFVMPRTPLPTGIQVQRAQEEMIARTLGLSPDGLYLGTLANHAVKVTLEPNNVVQKHLSVLAKTGSGKSYAVGVMMEELLKNNVPVVVIDPHGEHASLSMPNTSTKEMANMRQFGVSPKSYAEKVSEYVVDQAASDEGIPFKLDGRSPSARDVADALEGLTSTQTGIIHQAITELKPGGSYSIEDVVDAVREQKGQAKWAVLAALEDLVSTGIFSQDPTPTETLVQPGQASIVNLKGAPPQIQSYVVAKLCNDLFEERKRGRIPPHLVVLEEAHQWCPERTFGRAASGDILRTIASEGRKFGMGLCVVTQRPAKVDKNVLSQCGSQIILKVTNPNDLKAISSSLESLPAGIEDRIKALPIGRALVSDPRHAQPVFVDVRPRETRHGGQGVEVVRPERQPSLTRIDQLTKPVPATVQEEKVEHDPNEAFLEEVFQVEQLMADRDLEDLDHGRLEAVLAELERLQRAIEALPNDVDQGRKATARAALKQQHERVLERLRVVVKPRWL